MKQAGPRCWCDIDLRALRHNIAQVRRHVGPGVGILALAKADAYGHGVEGVAPELQRGDVQLIGCANVQEGARLRQLGVTKPVLLLSGTLKEELPLALEHDLSVTVSGADEIRAAAKAARAGGGRLRVHLKVDTGMGRLGCEPREAEALAALLRRTRELSWEGFYTHFACADEEAAFTRRQWETFNQLLPGAGVSRHCGNSAGMWDYPMAHGDIVRPGLALFGAAHSPAWGRRLRPVLSWKARVVRVREMPKGATVSYGAEFRAPRRMRVATLAVGYGDGLFRSVAGRAWVLLGGKRCRVLGRVTMDQIVVSADRVPGVKAGDVAVLLGRSGNEEIRAEQMAEWAGTIPYEIWCHITDRVLRVFHA